MMAKQEVLDWLDTLPRDCHVAIDDGGLSLVAVKNVELYCEVGGLPEGSPDLD